jgi:hypothetical protein
VFFDLIETILVYFELSGKKKVFLLYPRIFQTFEIIENFENLTNF